MPVHSSIRVNVISFGVDGLSAGLKQKLNVSILLKDGKSVDTLVGQGDDCGTGI